MILSFSEASEQTRGKWVRIGKHFVELMPTGLYTMRQMLRQQNLIMELAGGEYGREKPDADGKVLLKELAKTYLADEEDADMFTTSELREVLEEGYKFCTEFKSDGDGDGEEWDIGSLLASLQRHYRGNINDWLDTSMVYLSAVAKGADDKKLQKPSDPIGFVMAMQSAGVELG